MLLPTINKKFLLKLVVVLLLLGGGLAAAHAFQSGRIPDALLAQAERAHEQADGDPKKHDAAIAYLRQYLEFRRTDVPAMEKLVGWVRDRKRPSDAEGLLRLYDQILTLDPARHDSRREALKMCLRKQLFTDAEGHANVLTAAFPSDPQLWLDFAYARRGLSKHAQARECYEAALKIDPTNRAVYGEYAEFLINDAKLRDDARKVLDRMVAARPNDPDAFAARGRFFALIENEPAATADAQKAIELKAKHPDGMLQLAEQLQKGKDVAKAADLYRDGMTEYPTDARFVRGLAWLEVNRGNVGASVAALEDGMMKVSESDSFDLLVPLADLLLTMRDDERAKELVRKLSSRAAAETNSERKKTLEQQALYLKGRRAMSEGLWSEALEHLDKLRASAGPLLGLECRANLLISFCQQRSGDFDGEERTLKLLLGKDPTHVDARVALGTAYQNAGRIDDAASEFEQAAKSRFATAGTRATYLRLRGARLRAANAGKKEWDELDAQAKGFAPAFGSTPDLALLRAELCGMRRAPEMAVELLRAEAMKRPTDSRVWAAYAAAAADVAGVPAGLTELDQAQALCGDRVDLRLARAALSARDPARLRPLDPLAAQIDTWTESDQAMLLRRMVEVYDRMGDDAGAGRNYRRIAGRYPADASVWEGLFDHATRSGDKATAAEARMNLNRLDPNSPKTAALLNAWEVGNGRRTADAASAAEGLVRQFGPTPDRPEACIALAKLKALAGDTAAASSLFARGVRLDPMKFGPTQEYLAFLATTAQDEPLARLLTRLAQDFRWNGDPLRRAVRQTVSRVEPVAAKRLLDAVRPAVEAEPDGLGWLGDGYRAAGFDTDATACYDAATRQKTTTPDDWLRRAVRQAEAGEAKAAGQWLLDAKDKVGTPAAFLMTCACFAAHPSAPKGWAPSTPTATDKKTWTQARLVVALSRFDRPSAVATLDEHLADTSVPADASAWAKRQLAMLLIASGTPADRKRAKELLTAGDHAGDSADERRATAALLAQLSKQLDGADREATLNRAIDTLEKVSADGKNPRDKFLLAQMHRAAAARGDSDAAEAHRKTSQKLMSELIKADPRNVEYYIAALEDMTSPNDRELAERCAAFLITNFKSDFRVVQAVGRYECRVGRAEKALEYAIAFARTADNTPGDLQARQTRAAELLDELARMPGVQGTATGRKMTDTAAEKYEALFVLKPEAMVALTGLLAADGRAGEGFKRIEKHAAGLPSRVKVLAGLAILRTGTATDKQFDAVGGWLAQSANEEPGSVAMLLNAGTYHTYKGDLTAAAKAYTEALTKDADNVIALNNLAWVLAADPSEADRAAELVERAVRVVGQTGELLDTRARAKIARKDYAAAERDLLSAVKSEPTGLRLFHLCLAERAQGKASAGDHFREAVGLGLKANRVHPSDTAVYIECQKEYAK